MQIVVWWQYSQQSYAVKVLFFIIIVVLFYPHPELHSVCLTSLVVTWSKVFLFAHHVTILSKLNLKMMPQPIVLIKRIPRLLHGVALKQLINVFKTPGGLG